MWGFSVPRFTNVTYTGSIVDFSADRTIVACTADSMKSTKTVTIGGVTYVGYTATPTVTGHTSVTFVVTCSRANEEVTSATCLQSQIGAESKMSAYCQSFPSVMVQTTTEAPEWYPDPAAFSEGAKAPMTISQADMATYALVLIGGIDKLSATATDTGVEGGGGMLERALRHRLYQHLRSQQVLQLHFEYQRGQLQVPQPSTFCRVSYAVQRKNCIAMQ
jgi:hypothetical protein